jgi:2-hydroxy-6-oxonona-2,4-dienedioate hydrolase
MRRFLIIFCCMFQFLMSGFPQTNATRNAEGRSLQPFSNSHFVLVDSVTLHYRTWLHTTPNFKGKVLLIHGFIGSTFCWRENIDPLVRAGYDVVAVDLPGFGYSDRNLHVNQSQSNRAHLLWDFINAIEQNDSSRWNIVGHSMGGGTAEAMSLMKPDRIKSLSIVDGMVFLRNKNVKGSFVVMTRMKEYHQVLVALTKKRVIEFKKLQHLLKGLYGYIPDSTVVEGYLQPLQIEGSAECILNVFANAREIQHLHSDVLKELPVLVVWGKKDRTIRYFSAKKFINSFPNIDLKIIPGARHSPMETHAGIFNGYLVEFLNKNN